MLDDEIQEFIISTILITRLISKSYESLMRLQIYKCSQFNNTFNKILTYFLRNAKVNQTVHTKNYGKWTKKFIE